MSACPPWRAKVSAPFASSCRPYVIMRSGGVRWSRTSPYGRASARVRSGQACAGVTFPVTTLPGGRLNRTTTPYVSPPTHHAGDTAQCQPVHPGPGGVRPLPGCGGALPALEPVHRRRLHAAAGPGACTAVQTGGLVLKYRLRYRCISGTRCTHSCPGR